MKEEKNDRLKRLQIVYIVVFLMFVVIILRLAQIQIQQGSDYANELADRSYKKDYIPAMRGNIYDRNGYVIAESRPSHLAVFREQEIMEKKAYFDLVEKLEKILSLDKATLLKKMDVGYAYEKGKYVEAARQLPRYLEKELKVDLTEKEIAVLGEHRGDLPGIEVVTKPIRKYDPKQIAVQAVGYVRPFHIAENVKLASYKDESTRYLPNQLVGLDGIELSYEKELRGSNGYRMYEVAADQTVVKQVEEVPSVPGNHVYLTIDQRVQLDIRDSIRAFLPKMRATIPEARAAKGAYVVAVEVKTGKVVAMVSYPEYDPNVWIEGPDQKTYDEIKLAVTNGTIREAPYDTRPLTGEAAIQEGYKHPGSIVPSGSVLKPITVLLGLQEGIISPSDRWNDGGVYHYGRGTDRIKNDNSKAHGMISPAISLQKSSNTYMARIGEELSRRKGKESASVLQSYYHAFGLGVQTGVDLPNENKGKEDYLVMDENYGPLAAMVQASFGQQVRATTMQLAQYAATLANKGVRLQPQMVDKITDADGKLVKTYTPKTMSTFPHPEKYWDILEQGMVMVTKPGGTAVRAYEGMAFQVAAKTGTSEQDIYVPVTETDEKTGQKKTRWKMHGRITNGVSISYAPVDDPVLAVAVIVPEGGYGGRSAAIISRSVYDVYDKHIGLK
ncbi:penicillin-binding protein 2 [Brevibacillus sp. Leaf182]|uniref:peptidoglycan D,D-transpeptidase FtsI family protein n=1 Tax=Brevibacillus sp. Leaf182 TaxID=1736290 RepID=UPI0006FC5AC2|nr:penicillin-binding transpeptidase domain-containing protein [Brevibacillus sp. Leaf182]RAT97435.1 penicillin-binding protein [Brevibacillus sp. Leaf182]